LIDIMVQSKTKVKMHMGSLGSKGSFRWRHDRMNNTSKNVMFHETLSSFKRVCSNLFAKGTLQPKRNNKQPLYNHSSTASKIIKRCPSCGFPQR
jgi:hypothetical protein